MKKLICILATFLLFVFGLSACTNNPQVNNNPPLSGIEQPNDKPTDNKPADNKPADDKPADDKPTDNKPTDNKPADDKPTDDKSTENKPADDPKPVQPTEPITPEQPGSVEMQYNFSENGKYVYFGSYPQSQVTAQETIGSLNNLTGALPTADCTANWTSYAYYINGEVSNFMWYIDVEFNGQKYRGIYFTEYRPYYTTIESSEAKSYQDENGYNTETVYWFKYEPITWRILQKSQDTVFVMSENIIDSREFYPQSKGVDDNANNYENSSSRKWLNETFYQTAFDKKQATNIVKTEISHNAQSTGFTNNKYAQSSTTKENVYLLSYADITNSNYGFNANNDRILDTSDYAKAQGASAQTASGNGWWTRSANNTYNNWVRYVYYDGYSDYNTYVYRSYLGVVPALTLRLFTEKEEQQEPSVPDTKESKTLIAYFSRMGEGQYGDRFTYHFATALNDYIDNSTLFEIKPVTAYPAGFSEVASIAQSEWSSNARPAIAEALENIDDYDNVFIGYPIWYGHAPRIIYSFLDEYNLSDKNVYLFATSSSSGMGGSVSELSAAYTQVNFLSSLRVTSSTVKSQSGVSQIRSWVDTLQLSAN